MGIRRVSVSLVDRLPAPVARRLRGTGPAVRFLRAIANPMLPDTFTVVTVRSGRAAGTRIEIDPRSEKYYWLGTYEPRVLDLLADCLRPGDVFWDVGAHAGFMVAAASRLVGPRGAVVAFEPNPENAHRLRRTIEMNGLINVTLREVALSSRVGTSDFFVPGSSSMGSLVPSSGTGQRFTVETSTVDAEARSLPAPALVKIDVEGSELDVLDGAEALLATHHPPLIIEILSADQLLAVERRLPGYELRSLDDRNYLAVARKPTP